MITSSCFFLGNTYKAAETESTSLEEIQIESNAEELEIFLDTT